ncbi:hypothetical protein FSS13T_05930 [Flavobacterium saliperosum S13]|uniref:Outer membrane protein beta-barrel family protein n=2 Tax=Flavobacterium saliperosum TaxID=329186 RepID=A0A1G4VAZ7_9FLAO|nr:hypothetical protein [Flavobacterium saliperosum]ESU28102.1 hypothetical protein FSS13T_05930 [Flavobacterium saliperosum S13]SCX03131.1 hypothetical protein SAMN02927925_00620 [Flavobacterium saliperosum]
MLKQACLLLFFFCLSVATAQETKTPYQSKKITVSENPVAIDSISINKEFFKLLDQSGNEIDTTFYQVDFQKGTLVFKNNFQSNDTLTVRYLKFPEYLTKKYSIYDKSRVVSNEAGQNLYRISREPISVFKPFDGLSTSGSITRGVTVGNNQNTVVNSNLDLQITGKISEKVSLRASLQDSNIPLQEGGYSQKLDEFDQIFVELYSDKWAIRAGDLFLENRQSRFLNFNKKVQGLSTHFTFGKPESKTDVFAAGAIVRGQYARSTFTGQEGNQGPYKLKGPNGELYVLVISGSERVFVNGILLERGENNDYVIDYNAGELRFTSLFPITSEMRINVEYQYSDRSYTRFVTYGGVTHERSTWSIGGFVYSENDVKNQPLQQNLSAEQAQILVQAGDNPDLMTAPSAYEDSYSENKILYRKILVGAVEVFEYSNNPTDVLFNVKFTLVGNNQGNYILVSNQAVGRIYEYVAPVAGIPQGNFEPITRLVPPTKIQIATVLGKYNPGEKTNVDFEIGISNNDKNLFSSADDNDNKGIAGKINAKQRLFTGKWHVDAFANYQLVQKEFKTIERLFTIEFNRDWNLTNPLGDQSLLISGVNFTLPNKGFTRYQLEKLDFSESFSGTRHVLDGFYKLQNWTFSNNNSALKSDGTYADSRFIRSQTQTKYHFKKNWIGGSIRLEDNEEKIKATNQFSALSQRYKEFGAFIGRGDSTKVYTEIGYLQRSNDSLQNGFIQKVSTSHSYYLKSKLIQTEKSDLSLFVNYRNLTFEDTNRPKEPSLNSRLLYNDRFFNQLLQLSTAYETTSGTIPQQEFTYLEVEPGQGVYTWNDYNGNGIQELQEFEVAPFPDQAKYVRVFLPNQIFVKTHQNKFSQSVTLNPLQWQNETDFRKILSYFYNQTSFMMDRKILRQGDNFDLNPFSYSDENLLGLNATFRNSFFYNRGKQNHSVTYTYLTNHTRILLSAGSQESRNDSHQFQYAHLVQKLWLFGFHGKTILNTVTSENYPSKNFDLKGYQLGPKISYLFSQNASWDLFYEFQNKENTINAMEALNQQRFGTSFTYSSEKKFTANGEFSFYKNRFDGNQLSAVAFQMLEGLQAGENLTWRLLLQKNLTQYLDVNVNYQGRKSETSKAIHTGSIQLRAYF